MTKARQLADLGNAYDDGALSNRNLIINGSMAISQRSLSVSSQTATGYKTVDRIRVNGSGGTYNQSQQTVTVGGETGLPVQFTKFLRHECTVGNDNHLLITRIEDVSKFVGTMKLSFYAKGSGADVLAVKFHQAFGSGGSADIYTSAQSFTVTSTWQRFEFNIEMPSITGKTLGAGNYGSVLFGQDSSTSTAAWTLDITGLQWEHGDTATPFEHKNVGQELFDCQRYCQLNTAEYMRTYSTTAGSRQILLKPPMRATPTASLLSGGVNKILDIGNAYRNINSLGGVELLSNHGGTQNINVSSTVNSKGHIVTGGCIIYDAEL